MRTSIGYLFMAFAGMLYTGVSAQGCKDGESRCVKLSGEGDTYSECIEGVIVQKSCESGTKCFNSGPSAAMCKYFFK
ncbi:hypothetical protein BB560_004616 [Smittium megazygosporum]|uniref:Carbohydrate-binding module family 19 domain-containing protein n=1 Tax=Smittium megazygosporum TaxID=133381 RepID=A0A2T9Z8Q8_9FUNG|nr:hypothetical protein BB560_004616 [Smittium megazygosporum]